MTKKHRSLRHSVDIGDYRDVKKFLHKNPAPKNINRTSHGDTMLHTAVSMGNIDIVKVLMEHGARPEILGRYMSNCLFLSVSQGHLELVKLFLTTGSQSPWTLVNTRGYLDACLLHDCKRVDIAELLVSYGARLDMKAENGVSILHTAYNNRSIPMIRYLYSVGCTYRPKFIWSGYDLEEYKCWKVQYLGYLENLSQVLNTKHLGLEVVYYIMSVYNEQTEIKAYYHCVVLGNGYVFNQYTNPVSQSEIQQIQQADLSILSDSELLKLSSNQGE